MADEQEFLEGYWFPKNFEIFVELFFLFRLTPNFPVLPKR